MHIIDYTSTNHSDLLCDHAALLLLSIANIAQSEITTCPTVFQDDDFATHHHRKNAPSTLPSFPKHLNSDDYEMRLKPKLSGGTRSRHRLVSFDSPTSVLKAVVDPWDLTPKTTIPKAVFDSPSPCLMPLISDHDEVSTPKRSNKSSSLHVLPKKVRNSRPKKSAYKRSAIVSPQVSSLKHSTTSVVPRINTLSSPSQEVDTTESLQGMSPEGAVARKVYRKKFSWKNYPPVCYLY
jgi:hypothetical protein